MANRLNITHAHSERERESREWKHSRFCNNCHYLPLRIPNHEFRASAHALMWCHSVFLYICVCGCIKMNICWYDNCLHIINKWKCKLPLSLSLLENRKKLLLFTRSCLFKKKKNRKDTHIAHNTKRIRRKKKRNFYGTRRHIACT